MQRYSPEITTKIISNIFDDGLFESSSNIKLTVKYVQKNLLENYSINSDELTLAISLRLIEKNINSFAEAYDDVKGSPLKLESFLINSYKMICEEGVAAIGGGGNNPTASAKPVQDTSSIAKIDAPMDKEVARRLRKKREIDSEEI